MRASSFLLLFLLVSCAGQERTKPDAKPPAGAVAQKQTDTPEPQPPPRQIAAPPPEASPPEESEEELRPALESGLRLAISKWIAEHPEADFPEAARTANRLLRRHGYPMVLDAALLLRPGQTKIKVRSGRKALVFESGRELSASEDICGERFLRIPGRILGTQRAALVNNGREYPFSIKGFRRERFRIFRGKKLVATLYAPEPTEPIRLAANGRAVYLKFPLNEASTGQWWQRMARHQPSLLDEDPYLVVRVEKSRLYFGEDLEHLPSQEFEVEQSGDSAFRWKFQPSGLVLELSSRCDL